MNRAIGHWQKYVQSMLGDAVRFTHPPHPTDGNPVIGEDGAGTHTTDSYANREPNHLNAALNAGETVAPVDYRFQEMPDPREMYSQMSDRYRAPFEGRYTPSGVSDEDANYPNNAQFGIRPPSQYNTVAPKSVNSSYSDQTIGERDNIHAEPVMVVVNAFNELVSDLKTNLQNLLDARINVNRLKNILTLSRYALAAHAASAKQDDEGDPDPVEQLDDEIQHHPNDVVAIALHGFNECFEEAIDIVETADEIPLNSVGSEQMLFNLTQQLYEVIYEASLTLQRAGDRYDQFVVNISSPDELYPETYGNIDNKADLIPEEFFDDPNETGSFYDSIPDFDQQAFAEALIPDDIPMDMNVTQQLIDQGDAVMRDIAEKSASYSPPADLEDSYSFNAVKAVHIVDFRPVYPASNRNGAFKSMKHALSLRQLINAFNVAYRRIMAAGGGFIYTATPVSGLAKAEVDALLEEGLITVVGNKMTLSRMGYDRVQWLSAANMASVKPITSPSLTSKKPNTLY